jgi:hypothetical protein
MTLWHASTELHATAVAVVAKTVYLAANLTGRLEKGLCLGLDTESAELDTSG